MATYPSTLPLFFVFFITGSAAAARLMGGRFPVENVDSNQEIQELGRYSVHEYNRHLTPAAANGGLHLSFSRVVVADKQVVAGVKYYLQISAATRDGGGATKSFEAVVVVKPWAHSKELLSFGPAIATTSASNTNTKLSIM